MDAFFLAKHYTELANSLLPGEYLHLGYEQVSQGTLLALALHHKPDYAPALNNLANILEEGSKVVIGGQEFTKIGLYVEAIRADALAFEPYLNLHACLLGLLPVTPPADPAVLAAYEARPRKLSLPAGDCLTAGAFLERAVVLNPKALFAWQLGKAVVART
jgi:hypothetical protein